MKLKTEVTCTNEPIKPSVLEEKLSNINAKISELTPYIEEKIAYIGDTEVSFNRYDGTININVICNGKEIPYTFEVSDKIYVRFEPLEEVATVKIIIQ